MHITTIKEKNAHPFASKIPLYLWQGEFHGKFDDDKIPSSDKNLNQVSRGDLPPHDIQALTVLIIRYPDVPTPELLSFVQSTLKVPNKKTVTISAAIGRVDILKWLKEQAPNELAAMIQAYPYDAFRKASENGQLDTLKWLKEQAPNELSAMIQAFNYSAFRLASASGHLDTLKWLKEQASNELAAMIQAGGSYDAFCKASENGHLDTLKWLKEQAPNELSAMIQAGSYYAFRGASKYGHLDTLKWFKEQAPNELSAMIQAGDYYAFREASQNGNLNTLKWLLQNPQCLAYAELHGREYSDRAVDPFIAETLAALHQESDQRLQDQPNAIFDLTDPIRAQTCFYIIRRLIRRNDPAYNDELLFLLDIPAVKALIHTAVTPNEPNELLRFAINSGNHEAAARLLTIPAVRELAAANDFYRAESRGQLDLRALAQDRESSMHALTTGEQQRLAAAIGRYEPLIKKSGAMHLLESLRETLIARYETNPAVISVGGRKINLPTEWDDFQALKLTEEERQDALLAYEKNKDHTALRYLSKPNPWMAKNSSYVYINEDNRDERWSTFEEYTPEIVLFWLAAKDADIPPTDGHTLEGRIDHFIDELAHIGRAHNWDRSRQNANGVFEEYDDLEGDKPSCFSGVKRRLLQSVIGHPLLKLLTLEDVKAELRDFVRAHFIARITDENRALLKDTMEDYLYELDIDLNEGTKLLKAWDISPEEQRKFIAGLITKYGDQFKTEPRFEAYIRESFALEENPKKVSTYAHAFQFSGLIGLRELLEPPKARAVEVNRHGFFAPASSTTQRRAEQVDEEATLVNKKPKH